jgi:hypothetical protein
LLSTTTISTARDARAAAFSMCASAVSSCRDRLYVHTTTLTFVASFVRKTAFSFMYYRQRGPSLLMSAATISTRSH